MKKLIAAIIASTLLIACQPQTEEPAQSMEDLLVYYVALEGAEKVGEPIGCGDSIVPITITVPPTDNTLKTALENLLAEKQQNIEPDLYNALYQSNLNIDSATITNGLAEVKLTGTLTLGGVCDSPRVESQIERTILQFPEVKEVKVFLNGKTLQEALSQK